MYGFFVHSRAFVKFELTCCEACYITGRYTLFTQCKRHCAGIEGAVSLLCAEKEVSEHSIAFVGGIIGGKRIPVMCSQIFAHSVSVQHLIAYYACVISVSTFKLRNKSSDVFFLAVGNRCIGITDITVILFLVINISSGCFVITESDGQKHVDLFTVGHIICRKYIRAYVCGNENICFKTLHPVLSFSYSYYRIAVVIEILISHIGVVIREEWLEHDI